MGLSKPNPLETSPLGLHISDVPVCTWCLRAGVHAIPVTTLAVIVFARDTTPMKESNDPYHCCEYESGSLPEKKRRRSSAIRVLGSWEVSPFDARVEFSALAFRAQALGMFETEGLSATQRVFPRG